MPSRPIAAVCTSLALIVLSGCSGGMQRAQEAAAAQKSMIGMSKEQLLACMGSPANSAQVGETEVWTYNSGNGDTDTLWIGQYMPSVPQPVIGGFAGGQPVIGGFAAGQPVIGGFVASSPSISSVYTISTPRYCKVDIVMRDERVSRINYRGHTGGILTKGEQCAFAINSCARQLAARAPRDGRQTSSPRRAAFGVVFDDVNGD